MEKNINHVVTFHNIVHGDSSDSIEFSQEVLKTLFDMQQTEKLAPPENAGVFEKFLCKKLD